MFENRKKDNKPMMKQAVPRFSQPPSKKSAEDAYWREHHKDRPYTAGESYDRWKPAFQYGWEAFDNNPGKKFEDVEVSLRTDWEKRDDTGMTWAKAMNATRDAWFHAEHGADTPVLTVL